jgi:hypothetical protein
MEDLYVISVMTNPERFKTRPRYNVKLYIVEGAFGERDFEVTEENNPFHIQVRTNSEIWHKENLINIGISRLPKDWKYVAWIDADIDFVRPDWVKETVHELQHTPVVQMFENALDMGPDHEVMTLFKSFAYCYKKDLPRKSNSKPIDLTNIDNNVPVPQITKPGPYEIVGMSSPGTYWHPGYAWAATREAIDTLGGLFDIGIVGAGDHHMACCLIGEGSKSIPQSLHANYKAMVLAWEKRAMRLHKNIGYVKGTIYHFWHGKKSNRKYKERWEILFEHNFDPISDIHRDWQGVLTLHPSNIGLRDDIRKYFQERNEDSIDK